MYNKSIRSYTAVQTYRGGYSDMHRNKTINQSATSSFSGGSCCHECEEVNETEMCGSGFMSFVNNLSKTMDEYNSNLKKLGVSPALQAQAKKVGSQVETKIVNKLEEKKVDPAIISAVKAVSKDLNKEISKKLGKGMNGSGFWDFVRVLSFLPIPFWSDIARTASMIKTGIDKVSGKHKQAFDGVVPKLVKAVPIIGEMAAPLTEMVGFGNDMSENQALELLKISGDHLQNVISAIPESEKQLLNPEDKKVIDDIRSAANDIIQKAQEAQAQEGSGLNRAGSGVMKKAKGSGRKPRSTKEIVSGDGLKRAGDGIKRAGEGIKRAGDGMKRAGEGVGSKLKKEMIEKYGVVKY